MVDIMAKRTRRRTRTAASPAKAASKEIAVPKGLNYKKIGGVVLAVIGALLILANLSGLLQSIAGVVLIYFGLRLLGYHIKA